MRRKQRILYGICLLLLLVFVVAGCSGMHTPAKHSVAVITKSTNSDFWKAVQAGANAAGSEYNLDVIFEGPDTEEDYKTQNDLIRKAALSGAEVIVLSAIDFNKNAAAVNEAAAMGVKIVVIDSNVNSDAVLCRIGTDDYEAGQKAAQAALACTESKLHVGIVNFDKNTENGQSREKGFRDAIKKDARVESVTTINVVSSIENAQSGTIKLLQEHPEINVLVTFNEWTSLGVGWAVRTLKLNDTLRVVAFDSNPVTLGMLETGEVDALVVQKPYAMGYLSVETASRLILGHNIPEDTIYTGATLVTRENMYDPEIQQVLFPLQ